MLTHTHGLGLQFSVGQVPIFDTPPALVPTPLIVSPACSQRITFVHFSAQPEPFWSLKLHEATQHVPRKVLTSSREVEECMTVDEGVGEPHERGGEPEL